jgi:hypothetical protein
MRNVAVVAVLWLALCGHASGQQIIGAGGRARATRRAHRIGRPRRISAGPPSTRTEATLFLEASVRRDGSIDIATLKITGGDEAFAASVREVARYWLFVPPIHAYTCASIPATSRCRCGSRWPTASPR